MLDPAVLSFNFTVMKAFFLAQKYYVGSNNQRNFFEMRPDYKTV